MSEPDFIVQCSEPLTDEQRRKWCEDRADEAGQQGGTFNRWTMHQTIPNLILFECWKVRPDDQGEPRFQLDLLNRSK